MLVLRAERVFDGEHLTSGGVAVFVEDGRIAAVERAGTPAPAEATVADHPGATILPGLVDAHVHLCGDSSPDALDKLPTYDDAALAEVIEAALRVHLAAGVTTVRDLGDRRFVVADRRDGAAGTVASRPTVVASGPPITTRRGHCWNMGGEAGDRQALRRAVKDRVDHGVDIVKVMASGGVATDETDVMRAQFELDDLRFLVELAHGAGLPVTAHAHGLPAVGQAVAARVDGIEHCTCLTPTGVVLPDDLLETLAARRIIVDPTLGVTPDMVPPPRLLELMEKLDLTMEARRGQVARMHAAGVLIATGTDGGIGTGKPHGLQVNAVADLVAGGVATVQALASATSVAARACGLDDRKGWLRAGYDADLVVVDGNPVTDVSALHRVRAVAKAGVLVDALR